MKEHEARELVNRLRDIAIKYHDYGCLREKIATEIRPLISSSAPTGYAPCKNHCEATTHQVEIRRLKGEMVRLAAYLMRELHEDDISDRAFLKLRDNVVLKLRSIGLDGA